VKATDRLRKRALHDQHSGQHGHRAHRPTVRGVRRELPSCR
jgi:hypothetical protein